MIRRADLNDVDIIFELAHTIWPHTYAEILSKEQISYMLDLMYSKKVLRHSIENNEQNFYLLFEERDAIGFLSIQQKEGILPITYKLNKIYIHQSKQGKGYGKLLIDFTEKEIKQNGAKILELNVNRNNKALAFYKKLGFSIIREEDIDIGQGFLMEDYVMQKEV